MTSTIDNLLKFIPLIGFLLIGSGFVKLMIYYKAFKVRIFSFLDLQEVILSFTDNLIAYFFILTLTFITGFLFHNNLESEGLIMETVNGMGFIERLLIYIKSNWTIIIIIIALNVGAILFWKFRENIFGYEAIALIFVFWISLLFVPIFIYEVNLWYFRSNHQSIDLNYLILVMGAITMIFYVVGSAYNEINKVKKFNYFKGTEFVINNKKVTSTEKYYYVGQTKKYIFFYNSEQDYSEVFPIEKVEKFKFIR